MKINEDAISGDSQLALDLEEAGAFVNALSFGVTVADGDQRFVDLFQRYLSPIYLADLSYRIIAANNAFCNLVGRAKEELLGRDSIAFTHADDVDITETGRRRYSDVGTDPPDITKRFLHKDGRTVAAEVSRSLVHDAKGTPLYYIVSVRDVTERVKRDQLLRLVATVNHLAIGATDEANFTQQLCQALVDHGGYALGWIGITNNGEQGNVEVMCAAGATDYLEDIIRSGLESATDRMGPARVALRTGLTQVVNDQANSPTFVPWTQRAAQCGFRSLVVIPVQIEDYRAVLVLYHRDAHEFDDVTVKGLEAIVHEAEFAIAHIRSIQQIGATLEEITVAVKALKVSELARSESEERFRLAFEHNMAPMVFSDLDDLAIAVNDAFCEMVGFTREELLGKDSLHFTHPDDIGITEESHSHLVRNEIGQVRYEKRYLRRDGRVVVSEVSRSAALDATGKILYFVASERDVTEERALNAELSHKALHDSLTGLANRALFEDRLAHAHERAVRTGGVCAVLMLDLDDFKGVNETHGHLVGDQLLVAIARRFAQVTRGADTICRFGGDEFLYLAEGLATDTDADEVAARLLGTLKDPFLIAGVFINQSASIGIVIWDGSAQRKDELLQNADVALHEGKRHRRGNFTRFDSSMHEHAATRFELIQELRNALQTGDVAMHYQPIVDLATGGVVGFEALMRWEHPVRGPIPPMVFIPLAEQSDLILELGRFALREAVAAASTWGSIDAQEGLPYVTVNLSARQFRDLRLVEVIEELLRTSGLVPQRLMVEITESMTQGDIDETRAVIRQLNEIGVSFALDDFGTGYSSLSYLALLKPHIIKIDKSFLNPSVESDEHEILLRSIILIGDELGKITLAEGIETKKNLDHVRSLGCKLGQGYLFSRAVSCVDAAQMVGRVFGDGAGVATVDNAG